MSSKAQSKEKFKSKIGGQAVIEGVMMRGIDKAAMACRLPDGTIDLEEWAIKGGKDTPWYRKTPFVRGIFSFLTSLIDGYKCLTRSAEKQMTEDDEEEQTKFEQWLDDKLGDKLGPIITAISMVLGVGLAILLFMYLPSVVSKFISKFVHLSAFGKNIIEGILKIAIFIGYTALTALTKDIRRTYEYHGAEHKTIVQPAFSPTLRNELYFPCAVHKHFCKHNIQSIMGKHFAESCYKDSASAYRYGYCL